MLYSNTKDFPCVDIFAANLKLMMREADGEGACFCSVVFVLLEMNGSVIFVVDGVVVMESPKKASVSDVW